MKNIWDFKKEKMKGQKLTMVTAYDCSMARILAQSEIDMLLVGDSVAMVVHGFENTLHADMPMMKMHTAAVKRGASDAFIVADMPFLSFRKGTVVAAEAARDLMLSGAHAVKVEGVRGHADVIAHLVESGIPVMGHLGLTPQSIFQLGGFKLQGKNEEQQKMIIEDALKLQELGAFAIVLECVPEKLAAIIAEELEIPVIGIGAGRFVDGQVLVCSDILGMNPDFKPKFVRTYENQYEKMVGTFKRFDQDVKNKTFPGEQEVYQ